MDPRNDLPPGLRPPAGGEFFTVTWRADLGSRARLGDLALRLRDLSTAVQLGERWGTQLARAAAYQELVNRIDKEGPRAIDYVAERLGYRPRDLADLHEWVHFGGWPRGPRWRPGHFHFGDPATLLQAVADMELPDVLGQPPRAERVAYENPLEVVLGGSGLLLAGVASVLRLIRDWSNTRRQGAAEAHSAEAGARERDAKADQCEARADLVRWLVDEATAGRVAIPVGDLLDVVTQDDETALQRLAGDQVELQLPSGLDPPRADRAS